MNTIYDQSNVFAKILRGEIQSKVVYEDEKVMAFHDLYPVSPVHVLVIPKGQYINFADFVSNASASDVAYYYKKINEIATSLGISEYKILSNSGASADQTVFHFHTHIMG